MDLLPIELFDAICELVGSQEIASLRLVSKSICRFATPFLTSKIHLIFKADSFSRMEKISKHPIISKKITSILYESDMLRAMDRETWERGLISNEIAYRDMERSHQWRHSYSQEQLETGWANYQQLYGEQQNLIRHRCVASGLIEAMACLPNVTELRMSMGDNPMKRSDYLKRAFQDTLYGAFGSDGISYAPGVPQLMALLQATLSAGIKLQVLECNVSWRILQSLKPNLRVFADVLAPVRKLKIILTAFSNARTQPESEMPEYLSFLKRAHVRDLITQANAIQDLEIGFRPVFAINLANLIGRHHWPKLTSITLSKTETTEEEMLSFFIRHRSTLRKICLTTVSLSQGNWPSLVPRMRSSLDLEDCLLKGWLHSDYPRRHFLMSEWAEDGRAPEEIPLSERCMALREWFVTGGECPLTTAWSLVW